MSLAWKFVNIFYDPELLETPILVSPYVESPVTRSLYGPPGTKNKLIYAVGYETSAAGGIYTFPTHTIPVTRYLLNFYTTVALEGECGGERGRGVCDSFYAIRVVGFAVHSVAGMGKIVGPVIVDVPDGEYPLIGVEENFWLAILGLGGALPQGSHVLPLSIVLREGEIFFIAA